jgi:uncharacterized protein (DUF849 family)
VFVPSEKAVVEVAVNEQTTKTTNPHVRLTTHAIAESALAAAEVGAP